MRNHFLAFGLGILCHVSFFVAVAVMFQGLKGGMDVGQWQLSRGWSFMEDLILVLQFPLLHSLMLCKRGRERLAGVFPGDLGKQLVSTTFVLCASIQIIILFWLWSPMGEVWWQPQGAVLDIWRAVYCAAWVFLAVAMYQAGLGTQMGYLGWWSVVRGASPNYPQLRREGLFRVCRHPVYLAMAIVSVTGPAWSVDHVMIAIVFVTYCIVGPRAKDRRSERMFGEEFRRYRETTPFFPTLRSLWRWCAKCDLSARTVEQYPHGE